MKKIEEITLEEYEIFKKHRHKTAYNNDEVAEMLNITRLYVNPHTGDCLSCHSNFRKAKNEMNAFFNQYRERMEEILFSNKEEIKTPLEIAKNETKEFIEEKEKKKPSRKPKQN